ncbi:MAG: NosD domain-containing protein [Acidimicrobiales bacterium]
MAGRRVQKAVAALALALSMVAIELAGTAVAAPTIGCGTVITRTTKLTTDIGPCPGTGLVIAADNITVDLDGHRVLGDPEARGSGPDQAGVVLRQVHGVTLKDGTVRGFDAGVAIRGGGRNTITGVRALDNVNYRVVTGRDALPPSGPGNGLSCDLGDGIAVLGSNGNRLVGNTIVGNGPYSGAAMIDQSDHNIVANNEVVDNDIVNQHASDGATVCGGLAGEVGAAGKLVQDVGVRIEGPGATHNTVAGNHIVRSALAGVMVTAFRNAFPQANNGFNQIVGNSIFQTGLRTREVQDFFDDYHSSGIFLHNAGTTEVTLSYGNTIAGNTSSDNAGGGIEVVGTFPGSGEVGVGGNTITGNVTNNNRLTGILLNEGVTDHVVSGNQAHGNGLDKAFIAHLNAQDPFILWVAADAADDNYHCDANVWSDNQFGTVNQRCVKANGGTGKVVGPVPPAPAPVAKASLISRPPGGDPLLGRGGP